MRAFAAVLIMLASLGRTSAEATRPPRTIVVHGTVRDAGSTRPVAGAIIVAPSIPSSATSDSAGHYSFRISLPGELTSLTLTARRLGYVPVTKSFTITGDSLRADFSLTQQAMMLSEVVVTGTGKSAGANYLGSSVHGASVPAAGNSTVVQLRGATSGVAMTGSGVAAGIARGRALDPRFNTEEYAHIADNDFVSVSASPLSTFSTDVDRASYANVRRFIRDGQLPPKDAVRIEELINYFPYEYAEPASRAPVAITTDVADAPWNHAHQLVRIGLQTKRLTIDKLPPSNLVFLIDVSGSMQAENKLPLVKQAFRLLVNELREEDRVAIVVYAGNAGLVLPSTSAAYKDRILEAIESLEAGGSTAGGQGIKLAYDVALENFTKRGNNRVILATDGDFNIGISSTSELVRLIEERRDRGVYLTVLGFGMGNLKDGRMEQLADKGNGNYAYIDDLLEAKKVFVNEMGGTLVTVAKDVKLQIEFNPDAVQAYRLVGYENRVLRNEEFNDDRKDAGDMGAGHSVTALYEIIPAGAPLDVKVAEASPMRYQRPPRLASQASSAELLNVKVRYKLPSDSVSRLLEHPVVANNEGPCADFRFAMAVAGYGMLLRESPHKGQMGYDDVLRLARGAVGDDGERYRAEFVQLVERTRQIANRTAGEQR
jgi:Ca-activated chloride channel homolog